MLKAAIFLDRDGTINFDSGYVKNPDDVVLLEGVSEGIRKLKEDFGFKIIVISNQAGVAKGLMSIEDVEAVNERINQILKSRGTSIDKFYYCPYHPDFNEPEKAKCRKPSPFMIQKASEEMGIDLSKSFMIGDRESDIECGFNAGVRTILLKPVNSEEEISILHNHVKKANFVAANFSDACDFIIKDFSGGNS